MECEIVIREARPEDKAARAQLIESGITSYDKDAFFFFVFQELMLQLCVLGAAVLFIFVGASPLACALVPLALGAATALAVHEVHRAAAASHAARLRHEVVGFVAEYRGPLGADPQRLRARVVCESPGARAHAHTSLVGTASVVQHRGAPQAGWLHALCVAAAWRRRGVGGALLGACAARSPAAGLHTLEVAASALQPAVRTLLHANGWQVRGTYHRRLLGAALTLPMLHMSLDLPVA